MAQKRKGSVSSLPPVRAQVAYVLAGFAEQPCRVMINLNCLVNIILGHVKATLLEQFENQLKHPTEPPSNEEDYQHWKTDLDQLKELRGETDMFRSIRR